MRPALKVYFHRMLQRGTLRERCERSSWSLLHKYFFVSRRGAKASQRCRRVSFFANFAEAFPNSQRLALQRRAQKQGVLEEVYCYPHFPKVFSTGNYETTDVNACLLQRSYAVPSAYSRVDPLSPYVNAALLRATYDS